jgi:inner membrane protein
MPTVFTHMLVGGAAAQLAPAVVPKGRLAVLLALSAAIPDLDVIGFSMGIPYGARLGHRGLSHSLLFAGVLGVAVAAAVLARRRIPWRHQLATTIIAVLAVASHGLLDAATDAGLGIGFLIPFSDERFFLPFRPMDTAPLNPQRFFSAGRWRLMLSEMLWVWLPLALLTLSYQLGRRMGRPAYRRVPGP